MYENLKGLDLDDLLRRIGTRLELSADQHGRAKGHYDAVGEWFQSPRSPFSRVATTIYPQGSLRILTTVRPKVHQEFDLDLVLEFAIDPRSIADPVILLNTVEAWLGANETYRKMMERKNRCVRLNYAGQFHMDILPAVPDPERGDHCVVVPDREAQHWKPSNPRGYAAWFNNRAQTFRLSKRVEEIEPIPTYQDNGNKEPLRRAVQLLKRWRDVYYARRPEVEARSIVLTTLAATHYSGEARVVDAMGAILTGILAAIQKQGRLIVLNPMNPQEDFSEKWNEPGHYEAFVSGIHDLYAAWTEICSARPGIERVQNLLARMFDEELAKSVIAEQAEELRKATTNGALRVVGGSGALTTSIVPRSSEIRRKNFYGE